MKVVGYNSETKKLYAVDAVSLDDAADKLTQAVGGSGSDGDEFYVAAWPEQSAFTNHVAEIKDLPL